MQIVNYKAHDFVVSLKNLKTYGTLPYNFNMWNQINDQN